MELSITIEKEGLNILRTQAAAMGISESELASRIVKMHLDNPGGDSKNNRQTIMEQFLQICELNPIRSSKHEEKEVWCPLDNVKMSKVQLEDVLIDYCPDCFGIWFDYGELEALLKQDIHKIGKPGQITLNLVDDMRHKKCPFCGEDLYKREYEDQNIHLDLCKFCGGIWLDGGEFTAIYQDLQKRQLKEMLADVLKTCI
jgi:Zn-finger nucleic acid-binding protein